MEDLVRVKTRVVHGNSVLWNGTNIDEVRAVAGDTFVSLHSDYVILQHSGGGEVVWVRPGWWVVRFDGADDIRVYSAGAFAGVFETEAVGVV